MSTERTTSLKSGVPFECAYGRFQARYLWLFAGVGVIGILAVPIGIFANKGWESGGHPLEPWAATLIIEIFAFTAIAIAAAVCLTSMARRKSPQRVAVTRSALIVPKGMFSRGELKLPLAEIETTVFNVGFVKQLQIKHGRKKILLTSAAFPSDADFDRLVSHLAE